MLSSIPTLAVSGFVLGWSVAWPPVPINTEAIRRGLTGWMPTAYVVVLGGRSGHPIWALIAANGFAEDVHLAQHGATREINRTELSVSDEMFPCGITVEVLPIVFLDRIPIGAGVPGPLTRALQRLYQAEVREKGAHRDWLTPVEPARELLPDG